ncbi:MAG: D-alanyl-D-alanine-carboxypeptidase/endopeptidase AmpH [Deltaproteobacteria bacterium]|nr:D-alanyl-D-alanine-carboxypeptidase/endopeptidase AmpH [Deltaproteobacteria bacterium]
MKTLSFSDIPCRTIAIRCVAFATVLLSFFSWGGIEHAQADPLLDEMVEFNGAIFFVEQKVPAAVIGVVRNGEIAISGFGERAGKGSPEPDGDTVLRIGSITKAFTGQVLAQLAVANSLELTQPLTKTWPELAGKAKADVGNLRLIDLVTHAGGLPREAPFKPTPENRPIAVQDLTNWLQNNPLLFSPGKSVHYSNFGFDLLALSLEKAAGKPFPALVQQQITAPLQMKDTVFSLSPEQRQRFMEGHGFDGEVMSDEVAGHVTGGAGGLYSTPRDLLKWLQWHLDRFNKDGAEVRMVDHALYLMRDGLATVSGLDESGRMDAMGLGWVAMMPEGNRPFILQKAGGLQGTFSYIAFAPTRGVGVFIAINKFDFAAAVAMAQFANELIATLAPR